LNSISYKISELSIAPLL